MPANDPAGEPAPPRRPRFWPWFVAGFASVFIGMLFLKLDFYNGRGIFEVPAWRYYVLSFQQVWLQDGVLGPTSGTQAAMTKIAIQHLSLSIGGGAIAMAVAWGIRRFVRRS